MANKNHLTNASLSTMWAVKNYPDLNDFFTVSRQLGFQKVELNHQVDSAMLSNVSLDDHQFSSIHEPCPADISTKELVERDWLISSIDEESRILGVYAVRKSIDLAKQVGAPVVVVHCGTIPFDRNDEGKLRALYKAGRTNSDGYHQIKSQFEQTRQDLVGPRLKAVKKSLLELIEYATHWNIKLGLENRYHFMDIPSMDEMGELLALTEPSRLGFIYDVGHAQALDRLGFYPHDEWLKRYASRMFGCHLHDVIGLTDHYAPGLGEIDYKYIAQFLPDNAFRTFEILPGNTLAQVRDSLDRLIENGCIQYLSVP
ncbi:MAG TPA: TIM barrel protein [Anaerolineales bacterium]|nr:TIM barrel protein [Anaerolineales bacterium]